MVEGLPGVHGVLERKTKDTLRTLEVTCFLSFTVSSNLGSRVGGARGVTCCFTQLFHCGD